MKKIRCLFSFHEWKFLNLKVVDYFETSLSEIPYLSETNFLYVCRNCCKLKTQTIKGGFPHIDQDDLKGIT